MAFKLSKALIGSVKHLEITTKGIVTGGVMGKYKSMFKGRGLEFDSYRLYGQQDDASLIDWKASKRSNNILIKEYVEERDINIFFVIDTSASMTLGTTSKLKMEYSAEMISALYYSVLNSGDNAGFCLFNDSVNHKQKPEKGIKNFYKFTKHIVEMKHYGGKCNLVSALKFLLSYIDQYGIVFIVSDFIGLSGDWKRYLKIVMHKYDVIGIMVRDPIDRSIPKMSAQVVIEDPYTGQQLLIEPNKINTSYKRAASQQESEIKTLFIKNNSDFIITDTSKDFVKPLYDLFLKRAKKWR
jgi:uncharacterized protein (DUF58 family)